MRLTISYDGKVISTLILACYLVSTRRVCKAVSEDCESRSEKDYLKLTSTALSSIIPTKSQQLRDHKSRQSLFTSSLPEMS